MRLCHWSGCSALAALLTLGAGFILESEADDGFVPPAHSEINPAIDRGVAWLLEAQREDGSWGPTVSDQRYSGAPGGPGHFTGPTAFALFTLAGCEVSPDSKKFKTALKWLRGQRSRLRETYTSYERSALVLMLAEIDRQRSKRKRGKARVRVKTTKNPRTRPKGSFLSRSEWRWLDENVQALLLHVKGRSGVGYWEMKPGYTDMSATQFAALAFRAASLCGYPIADADSAFWKDLAIYHVRNQNGDGSFSYLPGTPTEWSLGMTAAALSTLVICREQMSLLDQPIPRSINTRIERGQAFLSRHFEADRNVAKVRKRQRYHFCYLYAIERVGVLTGRKEFGEKDWYLRGARYLVDAQHKSGRWTDETCIRPKDVLGTCFALLFLKKATIPVVTPRGK